MIILLEGCIWDWPEVLEGFPDFADSFLDFAWLPGPRFLLPGSWSVVAAFLFATAFLCEAAFLFCTRHLTNKSSPVGPDIWLPVWDLSHDKEQSACDMSYVGGGKHEGRIFRDFS